MVGNAAIYVRVSTTKQEQEGTSLESQEAACVAYARQHGYTVHADHIFREVHTGGELWERPRVTALRAAMKAGEFSAVIAYAVDRLSRDQAHLYILDDEATRAGVELLFVTEEFDKTPEGKLIRSVKGFVAEMEREKIKERTMRGMRTRVAQGRLLGKTPPPYGYRYADAGRSRLEPDPDTAPIVRRIFAAEAGTTIRRIAAELDAVGIPERK
jgi:site-specific DNA recombinase